MVRGTTIYPHAEDVYEFQLNQYPLHLVTIDPKIFTEPGKSFISEGLRYLLDRLSANK